MIDINVKGLLYVSKAIIPQMIERNLVTSSILALLLQRSLSKWKCILLPQNTVDALNQGMRIDLNPFGIRVGPFTRHGRNRI
jgi:NADP-dependent 3-hydroxy acid dehydrogenase YdfG